MDKMKKRSTLKGQLTRLVNFIGRADRNTDHHEVEARLNILGDLFQKLNAIQDEIENGLEADQLEDQELERVNFEDEYFRTVGQFRKWLAGSGASPGPVALRELSCEDEPRLALRPKLPPIDLPIFSGDLTGWQTYRDTFDSMVHNNLSLTNVNKFYYLKSTLRADPLKLVGSLAVTDAGYEEARKLLIIRYENKRCLTQAHMRALFEQSEVKSRSVFALRELIDGMARHLASLRALGENVSQWDTVLIYLIVSKLDAETRRAYELHFSQDNPSYENVVAFLEQRCSALERVEPHKNKTLPSVYVGVNHDVLMPKKTVKRCGLCRSVEHRIFRCPEFLKMNVQGRYEFVRKNNLCMNCLSDGHRAAACSFRTCARCSKRHNELLHFDKNYDMIPRSRKLNEDSSITVASGKTAEGSVSTVGLGAAAKSLSQVMLYTVAVLVRDRCGKLVSCRALVDTGSQACFVTESFVDRLGLAVEGQALHIDGIGGCETKVDRIVEFGIRPVVGHACLTVRALIIPSITKNLPQISLSSSEAEPFMSLNLADPHWYKSGGIDMLLSNSVFAHIVQPGVFSDKRTGLRALSTKWGCIVGGDVSPSVSNSLTVVSLNAVQNFDFNLKKFWEIEDMVEGVEVEEPGEVHFQKTVTQGDSGRLTVGLPFHSDSYDFTASRDCALERFRRLMLRFRKDAAYHEAYKAFINNGLNDGIFEVCGDSLPAKSTYYLPHHGVWKLSSHHTKLRCVFDGSAAAAPGCCSLNSVLSTGSKQQIDLVKIILRFRSHAVCFTADIARMFCQIGVRDDDRDFLRFFWKMGADDTLVVLRHTRLPFGLTCSPFIAIRCIRLLAERFEDRYPEACAILRECMYVDDLVTGSDSISSAIDIIRDLVGICRSACFEFRGWTSNSKDILSQLQCETAAEPMEIIKGETSVLGLHWDPDDDVFLFRVKKFERAGFTKRGILSQLSQLFDPLGWLSSVIVKGKILVQLLWTSKVGWDERVSDRLLIEWQRIVCEMSELESVTIPRFVGGASDVWLCGFSDASIRAYGACVYLVCNGRVHLIASKTRVALLKSVSLARLELCGALVCSRLMRLVSQNLRVPLKRCFCFSDSQIVLAWLMKPPHCWKVFVANRVSEIQGTFPGVRWSHVASSDNPADLCSRGLYPGQICSHSLWWSGPAWLSSFSGDSVRADVFSTPVDACSALTARITENRLDELIFRLSSFRKIVRVTAWLLRYRKNLTKDIGSRALGPLVVDELDRALLTLVRCVQMRHFGPAMTRLRADRALENGDRLISLTPFIDGDGVLRVGGRLKNSFLPQDVKHPMILPKNDSFVDKLIREEHENAFHMGGQFYDRASQLQGNLPLDRTVTLRPFAHVGVDLCGPFVIRPWKGRGKLTRKVYVALFVCFSVRAVHLEMVTDLSTDTFIAALKRFVGRRGRPLTIYSDNGRNFLGTRNYLKEWAELTKTREFAFRVSGALSDDHINWKIIPPRSPNFGGLWEGNIRIFKNCFNRVVGGSVLTVEELGTLLVQVEASMNSRPLCRASESADDLDVLTSAHFLMGANVAGFIDVPNDTKKSLNARWRQLNQIIAHYWRRWSKEYLTSLQCRYKNKIVQRNVQVGDIGFLVKEDFPTFVWPLCKVSEVFEGNDGLVRVLKLKTGDTIFKRSISSFCPLPDFTEVKSRGSMFEGEN